ncbi:hypothetical protein, partial [Limnoraphis robusta]
IVATQEKIAAINNKWGLGLTLMLAIILLGFEQIASWQDREQVYRFLLRPNVSLMILSLVILFAAKSSSQFVYFAF